MTRPICYPEAQHAYMDLTGTQISQAELQRLIGALEAGESQSEAVQSTYRFYAIHAECFEYCKGFENGKASRDAYEAKYKELTA